MRKHIGRSLISLAILMVTYFIIRFPLFYFHTMKQWPLVLLGAGIIAIAISGFRKNANTVPFFTDIGYAVGFAVGAIFHSNGIDPGGGRTDNLWIIWTAVMGCCITAGIILSAMKTKRSNESC